MWIHLTHFRCHLQGEINNIIEDLISLYKGHLDDQLRPTCVPIHHQAQQVFHGIKQVRNLIQVLPPALPYAMRHLY